METEQIQNAGKNVQQGSKRRINKTILILVLVFLLGLPSVFYLLRSPEKTSTTETEQNVLLATVGSKEIYKNDVEKLASEQYLPSAIDNKVLKIFLDVAIEREILDLEAEKQGITIADTEIDERMKTATFKNATHIKYELIKEKIVTQQVKYVEAYVIAFWVPPFIDVQQPLFAVQREEGKRALDEAEIRLRADEKPLSVARSLHTKYPSLKEILALNGFILNSVTDEAGYTKPKKYTFNKEELDALDDPEVYNAMALMEPNEVKQVTRSDGSGGVVIWAINKNASGYSAYDEFLKARKKELVTMHNAL